MRRAFIHTLTGLARKNKKIFLLTADLGFSIFENFIKEFPRRFINLGVAEQNMIGVASGLALSGKIVFVYSIIPFTTMRCFEQIRNDLCIHNLNVRIIGVGAGLSYGNQGPTHHAIEDVAIMRALPNMAVICPGGPIETELVLKESIVYQGPMYIRLGTGSEVHQRLVQIGYRIGKGILIEEGSDITIIGSGSLLVIAKQVCESLRSKNISVRFISMPTIKPLDKTIILKAARETKALFTIEEHSVIGGLGSAVAEVLAESNFKVQFRRFALPDQYNKIIGNQNYLLNLSRLSTQKIAKDIIKILQR